MKLKTNNKRTRGAGCLTIFGLIFLIPGLAVGFFALKNVSESLLAKNWVPVNAKVLEAELKTNRGSDSTTYRATGRFSYERNGINYESDQLFFGSGNDNIGSYHQDKVRTLKKHQNQQQTIQAWVNPNNPNKAVIFRDIRWGMFFFMMIFPAIFGGVGAGMIWWGRHAKKLSLIENELQARFPEQPWLWRQEWQSPSIKSNNKTILWFSVGFAIFWNLISTPLLFMIPSEILDKKNYLALIGLLFPLVGIGLAAWAFRNYRQWKRFGESTLTLQELPARLGQTLRGDLHIPAELPRGSECLVRLECVHSYSSGSGDDRKTVENIVWQDEQRLNLNQMNTDHGHNLPIVFKLPKNQPISDWEKSDNQKIWRIQTSSVIPGADFSASFEIPVFESNLSENESEAELEEQFYAELSDDASHIDSGDWSRLGIVSEQTVQGQRYYFPPARLKGMVFMLFFMALIFGGVGVWGLFFGGSKFLGAIFGLCGLGFTYAMLNQLLYRSEVNISYDKLNFRGGWFGGTARTLNRNDIKRIYKDSNMSSGNVKYYGIYIDTLEKNKIKLAADLVGNRDVDSLIAKIADEFGLKGL